MFFFLKIALPVLSSLYFHINIRISLLISKNKTKPARVFIRMDWIHRSIRLNWHFYNIDLSNPAYMVYVPSPPLIIFILVRILQRNRINYINDIYMKGFIMGIGSWDYGSWDMLQYAICKLENQKSKGYNSVWVQRPEDRETAGVSPKALGNQELWCPRAG